MSHSETRVNSGQTANTTLVQHQFFPECLTANIYSALNSVHLRHQLSEALFKCLILPLDPLLVRGEYKIVGSSQV